MPAAIRLTGANKLGVFLAGLKGELADASRRGQNKMAYTLMQAEREQLRSDVDSPTPWSVQSILYKPADSNALKIGASRILVPGIEGAGVFLVDRFSMERADERHPIGVQIRGGEGFQPTAFESVLQQRGIIPRDHVYVPARNVRLDRYGNIPGAQISAMLSHLGLNQYGVVAPESRQFAFFPKPTAGVVGGELVRRYAKGVLAKIGDDWVPYIYFVPNPGTYRSRFDFYGRADREIETHFRGILDWYVTKALQKSAGS